MRENARRPIVERIVAISNKDHDKPCLWAPRLLAITCNLGDSADRLMRLTDALENEIHVGRGVCSATKDSDGNPTELWTEWVGATRFL